MPVPAPNLYPPFNIVRLSHVELMVTNLGKSRAFYVDTLGLQVTHEDKDPDLNLFSGYLHPEIHLML